MWLTILSDQLPIVALVSSYLTNKLIGHRPIPRRPCELCSRRNICGIVGDFSPVFLTSGQVPMCYSPVRHSLSCERAFDLHVLGTPPAFILSQDQTRHSSCECIFHTTATQRCSKHCKFASRLEARCRYFKLLVRRIDRNGVLRKQDKLTQRSSVVLLHSTLQLFRVLWFVLLLLVEPQPGKPVGLRLYSWCRSGVRGVRARR